MPRLAWTLPLLCVACSGPFAAVDRSALPGPDDYPGQDAVILLDAQTLRYAPGEGAPVLRRVTRRRTLVLTPKGSATANLAGAYDRTFGRLVDAKARITRPDGTEQTFSLSDMADLPSVDSALYSSTRYVARSFGDLPAGTVVQWQIEVDWENPTWLVHRFGFGARAPVKEARLEVELPEGWRAEHATMRAWQKEAWAPEVVPGDGVTRLVWARRDLPAVEAEPLAPDLADVVPMVYVRLNAWTEGGQPKTGFGSLEDYARWMYEVQSGTHAVSPAMKEQVQQILRDAPADPSEQARLLYEWVQSQIRYVSVQIGMGGWRPHEAQAVFEHGYGDCKDKANLLRAMLQVAGIDSHLVELYSHRGVPRPFVLPGVGNGNHAILAVHLPDRTVLADPTERTVPFGALPPRDQGAHVLVIHPERPEVQVTPQAGPADNTKRLRIDLTVPPRGVATKGTVQLETRGSFAWYLRHSTITGAKGEIDDLFERWDWMRGSQAKDVHIDVSDAHQVRAEAKITVRSLGTEAGERLIFRPAELLYSPGRSLTSARRTQPVVFTEPVTRHTIVRLDLAGAEVGALPGPTEVRSEFGRFVQTWSQDEGAIVVDSRFERTTRYVPAARYAELRRFLDAVVAARSQQVVIRRKPTS